MVGVDTSTDLASEMFDVVGRFRRQLRRSVGRGFDATGLTQSQAELLRLVGRQPGISVREAAADLGLVPNTASTLVTKLVGGRSADPLRRRRRPPGRPPAAHRARPTHRRRIAGGSPGDAGRGARRPGPRADRPLGKRARGTRGGDPNAAEGHDRDRSDALAIDCRNLVHSYGRFTAVDDFSLAVRCR